MARRQQKAGTPASSGQQVASTQTSRKIRPSDEYVEVSSYSGEQLHHKGPERGLDKRNVIGTETKPSIEGSDNTVDKTNTNRRMTRGLRHGRSDHRIKYDAKYHPMDEVTRPAQAAKRRSGSRSASASGFKANDGDTSDASVPSSARLSDREDSDEDASSDVVELPARTPNPRAVRHSTRAEANKSVNYSRKHHPQDHALPGHQQKAKRLQRAEKKLARQSSKRPLSASPDAPSESENGEHEIGDSGGDVEDSLEPESEMPSKQPAKPRKKLRTLQGSESSSPYKSADRFYSQAQQGKHDDTLKPMSNVELEEYRDNFNGGFGLHQISSDSAGAAQQLNGMVDEAQASTSSACELAEFAAAKLARPLAGLDAIASDNEQDPPGFDDSYQTQHDEQVDTDDEWQTDDDPDMNSMSQPRSENSDLRCSQLDEEKGTRVGPATVQEPSGTLSQANGIDYSRLQHTLASGVDGMISAEAGHQASMLSLALTSSTRQQPSSSTTSKASSRTNSGTDPSGIVTLAASHAAAKIAVAENGQSPHKTAPQSLAVAASLAVPSTPGLVVGQQDVYASNNRSLSVSGSPSASGAMTGQITPLTSFNAQVFHHAVEDSAVDHFLKTSREGLQGKPLGSTGPRLEENDSQTSLRSPELTLDRKDIEVAPSQRSQKDLLIASDPSMLPSEDTPAGVF